MLAAKNAEGISGLSIAAQNGHAQAIAGYISKVFRAGLAAPEVMQLLLPEDSESTSAFSLVMAQGNIDVITAYTEEVLNSTLTEGDKVRLLHACYLEEEFSALRLAIAYGKHRGVEVFFDSIIASNISDEAKKVLLTEYVGQHHLLSDAVTRGHSQVVSVYIEGILRLNLSKDEIRKALFVVAVDHHDRSGLNNALENNDDETVWAYIEGVSKTKDLELIKELLAPTDLGLALSKGFTQAVTAYIQAVLASGLGPDDIKALITTKGFALALKAGHVDTVVAYIAAVLNSNLSEEDKKAILMAPGAGGELGLYAALTNGNQHIAIGYIQAVFASSLSAESKQALIVVGLQDALHKKNYKAVNVYAEIVHQQGLDRQAFFLIIIKESNFSLYDAFIYGDSEIVRAHVSSFLL